MSKYYNSDMAYDATKDKIREKIGDRLKVKLTIDGKESVWDLTGMAEALIIEIVTDTIRERIEKLNQIERRIDDQQT